MGSCENCFFYSKEDDDFRQKFDDMLIVGESRVKHYCEQYPAGIPHGVWNGTKKCGHFWDKEELKNG